MGIPLLSLNRLERPSAPASTWDFDSFGSWRADVWRLVADFANEKVRSAFIASPPAYVVCDDLSWLDLIVQQVHGFHVDSKSELSFLLREHFDAMRAVHGTKTTDVATFYKDGLQPLNPGVFQKRAREIFLGGDFPELSDADLEMAISDVGLATREGHVYFETNERALIADSGHYMLYGSEYLTAIAAHLGRSRDYRQALRRAGKATLFVCDVPLAFLSSDTLDEFAGTALEYLFRELLEGETFTPDPYRGGGFSITRPLPKSCIVGHCHPTITRDPLRGGA